MATTIPCVLRALGNKNPLGFTKGELLGAFIDAGYNPEKAYRRYRQCVASHQIVPNPDDDNTWISLYCPGHWRNYPDALQDVRVIAAKIERDGTITYL